MVCGDDISLIINKNNLTITSFFFMIIHVLWLQTAICFLFAFFICFFFFRGAFNIQASNVIYDWVMRYQSLEINYHTAPNNKSTALPILQKLISIMVCLLGRAEYSLTEYDNNLSFTVNCMRTFNEVSVLFIIHWNNQFMIEGKVYSAIVVNVIIIFPVRLI